MKFNVDSQIKYKQIREAQLDNDVALELMGKFAVDDTGNHFTPERWAEIIDDLDFPQGITEMWTDFQQALLPQQRRVAT